MKSISPKQEFLATLTAAQFADVLGRVETQIAIRTALAQFTMEQLATGDLNAAAVAHIALSGAKRYVEILLNLCDPGETARTDDRGVLQHAMRTTTSPAQRAVAAKRPQ